MTLSNARAALAALALALAPFLYAAGPGFAQGTTTPPAAAKPATPAAGDPVVATVNGTDVHRSDLEAARADLPSQYQSYPIDVIYRPLLDRVIDGILITTAARKDGLQNDPEVKARLVRSEDQIIRAIYISRQIKARVTDDMLKKRYQEFLKANPPEPEIHARHILLKTEDEAKAVIKELQGGADFVELAKKHSTGPSQGDGGDLGFIKRGDVVPEFADAAFKLKAGQYSDTPVKTQFGWHVIKIEAVRTSTPPSFEEAKADLTQEATRDLVSEVVKELQDKAKIARFNIDGGPLKDEDEGSKDPAPAAKPAEKKP